MTLVSPANERRRVSTRTFIPHRCHAAIGVLGAVSVATACHAASGPRRGSRQFPRAIAKTLSIEHPTGEFCVVAESGREGRHRLGGLLRTARKLFDGTVFG